MEDKIGGSHGPIPIPVDEGGEYEVEIVDISRRGDGVAKIDGFVIFVPGTRRGDKVRVRINRVNPRFATAEVVK